MISAMSPLSRTRQRFPEPRENTEADRLAAITSREIELNCREREIERREDALDELESRARAERRQAKLLKFAEHDVRRNSVAETSLLGDVGREHVTDNSSTERLAAQIVAAGRKARVGEALTLPTDMTARRIVLVGRWRRAEINEETYHRLMREY
jgi:hypothetical protein